MIADDNLARAKGHSPEQVEARQRVARLFARMHLKDQAPLAAIDFTQPLTSLNAQKIDVANPKSKGFLGLGNKPAYLVTQNFPPKKPDDPLYALEYFPLRT